MPRAAGNTPYYKWVLLDKTSGLVIPDCDIELPSVTHIISAVIAKPALVNWAYRKTVDSIAGLASAYAGSDEWYDLSQDADALNEILAENFMRPVDIRDEAAERGTEKHALLEVLAGLPPEKGKELAHDWSDDTDPFASAIGQWWLAKQPTVVASEQRIYSLAHGFAGTCDLIWKDQFGNLTITDLKTGFEGRMLYDTDDIQTGAYSIGFSEMYPGTRITRRSILIVREDGTHGEYTCTLPTDLFLKVKAVYDILFPRKVVRK